MDDVRYQVFVSSTYEDLIEERKQVTQAILECECFPAGMELFPASNKSQWDFIKRVIDESDIYLVVIAGRYGSINRDKNISYTEMEFDYAMETDKPIIVLIHNNIADLPSKKVESTDRGRELLENFTEKAKEGRLVKFWSNKDDIKSAVITSLTQSKKYIEKCGWIRLNEVYKNSDEETTRELSINNEKLKKELRELKKKNSELVKELSTNKTTLEKLSNENKALQAEIENTTKLLNKKLCESQTKCEDLASELDANKKTLNQLQKEVSRLRNNTTDNALSPKVDSPIKSRNTVINKKYIQENVENTICFWDSFANTMHKHKYISNNQDFIARLKSIKYYAKDKRLNVFFRTFNSYLEWKKIFERAIDSGFFFSSLSVKQQLLFINNPDVFFDFNKCAFQKIDSKALYAIIGVFFSHYLFLIEFKGKPFDSNVKNAMIAYKHKMDIYCDDFLSFIMQ